MGRRLGDMRPGYLAAHQQQEQHQRRQQAAADKRKKAQVPVVHGHMRQVTAEDGVP